jgi:hypothetical protein
VSREQAGSKEQGARSREQGAGSKQQGAGSREQGAGSKQGASRELVTRQKREPALLDCRYQPCKRAISSEGREQAAAWPNEQMFLAMGQRQIEHVYL